ncbi:MAG: TraB/GumN family protein [Bacteroidetes bacterium]|nr:MAG: TraB/GumN family protein [Bacteroidota bacterium]
MKYLIAVLLITSSYFVSISQETSPFPLEKSSLLWKIEGNGIKKGSYLFGTMHLIEKENFIFPDKLEKLFKKSDVLVMELPGLPNQLEAMKYITLSEGSFFDYFTPEQTDTIIRWAQDELKMSEEKFRSTMTKMKPFVVVQMATQLHFMGKTESYEMTFDRMAREEQKKILGLETVAEQMAIFDNLTDEQQTEMVMSGIRNMKESIDLTKTMQELYVRQNVDSLYLMIQEEGGVLSEEQQNFLDERNKNWIPKINEIIADKKAFIAVGAGHLGGPNGVIRLLQKEGYTLTPVEL